MYPWFTLWTGKNWLWIDNSNMDYMNWMPGKPVVAGSCSVMDKSTGMWKDAKCVDVYGYVCKFPKSK